MGSEFWRKIRGGTVTIEYINANESWNGVKNTFIFYIGGKNPDKEQIKEYLNAPRIGGSYLERYWFLLKLMKQESSLCQFNPRDIPREFKIKRMPVYGWPAGFGLGQIDNFGKDIPIETASISAGVKLSDYLPGGTKEYRAVLGVDGKTYMAYRVDGDDYAMITASDEVVWNWKKTLMMPLRLLTKMLEELLLPLKKTTITQ